MGDLTANFDSKNDNLHCPCCGQCKINRTSIERLQALREEWGKPFSMVEGGGYRCEIYNESSTGAHTEGKAFDVTVSNADYYNFIFLAMKHGFTGVGVKNKGGRFQLHLDDAESIYPQRPRPYVWTY